MSILESQSRTGKDGVRKERHQFNRRRSWCGIGRIAVYIYIFFFGWAVAAPCSVVGERGRRESKNSGLVMIGPSFGAVASRLSIHSSTFLHS